MGLDLFLVKKSDVNNITDETELTYGRKTWNIANYFIQHPNTKVVEDGWLYEITKSSYMELCSKALPYENFLKAIEEDGIEDDISEQTGEYIIKLVLESENPQLGYAWEARALYSWCFVDQDKILKAFDEEPVYMLMSY